MEKQSFKVVLGRDEQGGDIAFDLAALPHLLIGGSTGSGKSVCIKSILSQLMRTKTPDEVEFIIYDEKCIEFRRMGNCPYSLPKCDSWKSHSRKRQSDSCALASPSLNRCSVIHHCLPLWLILPL